MPSGHDCLRHWGASAEALTGLLAAQTTAERKAVKEGTGRRPRRPYEGWIHRVKERSDYKLLLDLYYEMCLAIKQPTDIPTHWQKSEVKGRKGAEIDGSEMARLARETLTGLEQDGTETDPGENHPVHTESGVARYGTPNWLEKPPGRRNFDSIRIARRLLSEFRGAFAR